MRIEDLHSLVVSGHADGLTVTACLRAAAGGDPLACRSLVWRIETANGPADMRVASCTASGTTATLVLKGLQRRDTLRLAAAKRMAGANPFRILAVEIQGPDAGIRFVPGDAAGFNPLGGLLYSPATRAAA